ncbi:hypothetical protein K2173_028066 [Erythroxylum novogranatense]|uniref:Uncharacterized protein n=1 Tax=Erythroxylum novogranatense TaxID=1862640 RepID=A0AAV8U440_9ROSI|nr:hypothetical protein K2173_028066 [Erythroxylum novogranatense]
MKLLSLTSSKPPYAAVAPPLESFVQFSLFPSQCLKLGRSLTLNGNVTRTRYAPGPRITCCMNPETTTTNSTTTIATTSVGPPVVKKRRRYRKAYPGESKGITEEMRFVAMRLRNINGKYTYSKTTVNSDNGSLDSEDKSVKQEQEDVVEEERVEDRNSDKASWFPSMEGFVKYMVDSKLVFDTVERIIDNSDDVSYAYFRNNGLERSKSLAKDLDWFSQKDVAIPQPSAPGVSYAEYLEELAEKSAPLFLCHFYNIYFSHVAGGQVITRQVSDKLFEGRDLEFHRWDGDAQEMLKSVREKLNMLGEHWSRDVKNRCLKEATKSFRYLGQIVRLIIL